MRMGVLSRTPPSLLKSAHSSRLSTSGRLASMMTRSGWALRARSSVFFPVYARSTAYPFGQRMLSRERVDHS